MTPAQADELLNYTIQTNEGRQDPYPVYSQLRESPGRWRSEAGAIVLTSYKDCLEVLRHPKLGRAEADMDLPLSIAGNERRVAEDTSTMLLLNPRPYPHSFSGEPGVYPPQSRRTPPNHRELAAAGARPLCGSGRRRRDGRSCCPVPRSRD